MPETPCTGVENFNVDTTKADWSQCPGEDIWSAAQQVVEGGSGAGSLIFCRSDRYNWGLSINPVSRRGQHQVR